MGIEDPGLSKIIIVIGFISLLLVALYFSKNKGKGLLSKISPNNILFIDETVAISNISRASIVSANNLKFLVIHGKGQSPSITPLSQNIEYNSNSHNEKLDSNSNKISKIQVDENQ